MATVLYLITAFVVSIPIIAAIVMPKWIKHDEYKLRSQASNEVMKARHGITFPDELDFVNKVTDMKLKRMYPNIRL
jgi:hypothetical protein